MSPTNPNLVLHRRITAQGVLFPLSLVYIAALLQARVTTYTPNLPLMLYPIGFVSYI